jgi:hypothetical protein
MFSAHSAQPTPAMPSIRFVSDHLIVRQIEFWREETVCARAPPANGRGEPGSPVRGHALRRIVEIDEQSDSPVVVRWLFRGDEAIDLVPSGRLPLREVREVFRPRRCSLSLTPRLLLQRSFLLGAPPVIGGLFRRAQKRADSSRWARGAHAGDSTGDDALKRSVDGPWPETRSIGIRSSRSLSSGCGSIIRAQT